MTAQPPLPPQGTPPGGPGVAAFFDRIRRYGAVRPDDGRWFAGVAAGLARRWGVDPLLVRGGFVILTISGGVGLLLYGLGWLFLPHPDGRIHAQEVLRGVVTAGFIGGLLLVALVVFAIWWFAGGRHGRGPRRPDGWYGPGGGAGPGGSSGPGGW